MPFGESSGFSPTLLLRAQVPGNAGFGRLASVRENAVAATCRCHTLQKNFVQYGRVLRTIYIRSTKSSKLRKVLKAGISKGKICLECESTSQSEIDAPFLSRFYICFRWIMNRRKGNSRINRRLEYSFLIYHLLRATNHQ